MGELRALLAVARKDLKTLTRYRVNLIAFILLPLYQGIIPSFLFGSAFLVDGRAVGLEASTGTGELAGFLFAGTFVGGLILWTLWGIGMGLQQERFVGTLEPMWLTPARPDTILLGKALAVIAVFLPTQLVLLAIGVAVFGARFRDGALAALPAMALALVAMLGVAYALAGLSLVIRELGFIVDAGGFLFVQASGASFPITALPGAFQAVALALPTTYAMDIVRQHALGTRPLFDPLLEHAVLAATALALLPLGRWAFGKAERAVRVQGSLAQH